jgi:hypothetical protein
MRLTDLQDTPSIKFFFVVHNSFAPAPVERKDKGANH